MTVPAQPVLLQYQCYGSRNCIENDDWRVFCHLLEVVTHCFIDLVQSTGVTVILADFAATDALQKEK